MDRGVRAIVSHRLPNAEELNAGCGDWLECCQAYIHTKGCTRPSATNSTSEQTREKAREIAQRIAEIHPPIDGRWVADECPAWIESITELVCGLLSSRDTEIREVLEGLARWINDEWCWCPQVAQDGNGALIHFDACARTSTLYATLQPPEKSLPGE